MTEAYPGARGPARAPTRPIAAWIVVVLALSGARAFAQDDISARARAASSAGQGAEATAMLESHLAESPRDVDARLTYGLILSWNGRYDEARAELQRVLLTAPDYEDARVALMNVEWWSGRTEAARDLSRQILSRNSGNTQAKLIQQRLNARSRPWTAMTWYSVDAFNDGDPWHEVGASLGRETPHGSIIFRGTNAARFGYTDQLVEVEAYPTFRAGTYAFVGIGAATGRDLYPSYRAAFDLYQSLGHGLEVSGGYRRLNFSSPVSIYVGTLTQYFGQWSVIGRTFFVPSAESDSWSFHAESRRYLGGDGRSFVGLTLSQGFSEEPRGVGDIIQLKSNTLRGQADIELTPRTRLLVMSSASRQERALRIPLWQFSVSAGAGYRF